MLTLPDQLARDGYAITAPLLNAADCIYWQTQLASWPRSGAGSRRGLRQPACRQLGLDLQVRLAEACLPLAGLRLVQCSYFEKSAELNWLVSPHQDLSIPVADFVNDPVLQGWSYKEGVHFVQPPDQLLSQLLAIRLHLDDCAADNGALKVVPASHQAGRLSAQALRDWRETHGEQLCPVAQGAVMLMRPLLIHASAKCTTERPRRVLHYLFGPPDLPYGLRWAD